MNVVCFRLTAVFLGIFLLATFLPAKIHLGMSKQDLLFELGRPTSMLSRPGMEILIYPNDVKIILEDGVITEVDGMDYALDAEAAGVSAGSGPGAEVPVSQPPAGVVPEPEPSVPLPEKDDAIPSLPGEGEALDPELRLTPADAAEIEKLETAVGAAGGEPTDTAGDADRPTGETGWDADFDSAYEEPSLVSTLFRELIVNFVIMLVIVKITANITGVTAFWPGIVAIALIDSLVRSVMLLVWTKLDWWFYFEAQLLVSVIVLLYLVSAFSSAREWPTIIRFTVMTKVIAVVLSWIAFMFVLNV